MILKEMNLGPAKIRFFDDKLVQSEEEIADILKEHARIVQNAYIAQELKKRKEAAI